MEVEINCCECGRVVGTVSEETAGYIGTSTLCDPCDEQALADILENS